MYMRLFGTWKMRSLYRSLSLKRVTGELAKYRLHLFGIEEVRWENVAVHFTIEQKMKIIFLLQKIMLAVKRVEFDSDL
jgi:hypothetical protein